MLTVEHLETSNWRNAIRGARNPMNSWDKSDTGWYNMEDCTDKPALGIDYNSCQKFVIGDNDLNLLKRLCYAGSSDRKFLRQIFVSVDITAPLYWWKEMDQYKVGTTTDSCSTMHKIQSKEFTMGDFSTEHLLPSACECLAQTIGYLNDYRGKFLESKDKEYWWQMIQLLPTSYNQKRTWTGSLETVLSIIHQRQHHKLDEWHTLCDAFRTLPYVNELYEACFKKEETNGN